MMKAFKTWRYATHKYAAVERRDGALADSGVAEICVALVKKQKLSEKEALREVFHSRFYQKLLNPKTALVIESRSSQVYLYMQQRVA